MNPVQYVRGALRTMLEENQPGPAFDDEGNECPCLVEYKHTYGKAADELGTNSFQRQKDIIYNLNSAMKELLAIALHRPEDEFTFGLARLDREGNPVAEPRKLSHNMKLALRFPGQGVVEPQPAKAGAIYLTGRLLQKRA